ncbi:phage portal protein, SPP1 family [Sphingobacterium multivorum]|uniref:phage portal protein n=1 Tax=Sphingobacterium multivorum TaxID=28454 RepID=UPI000DF9BE2C|nr:phage portal protein [Sphingobacterium multivorum]QQT43372.1 phage portal protein [Sphingobacterium multivorum]SUI98442.1 phage portal protein, SPP1 family [Sphingobacterium multivorum]
MTREQLKTLIDGGDFTKTYDVISKSERRIKLGSSIISVDQALMQYDPFLHDVNDPTKRENRKLELEGEEYTDEITGQIKTSIQYDEVQVNRLQLARQKQIVQSAIFFECGADITIEFTSEVDKENRFFGLVKKVWDDTKMSFKNEDIVERRMVETHCAELWYDYPDENYWKGTILEGSTRRPGMMLLCKENGDDIYPIWDEHDDFIGLGRKYSSIDPVTDIRTLHFELYTADTIILGKQADGGKWEVENKEGYKFVSIVYHSQKRPEWADVQPLSDREENNLSNLSDTNDYYGDPAMVVEGDADSLPSKGEVAKVIQVKGENGARGSISFAQPESMVESKTLEFDRIKQEQFDITNTPDIGFNTMSKLMSNGTSGIALRLLFMGPQMKGNKSQKRFKEMIIRRLNVIKKMLIEFSPEELADMINVRPNVKFKDALPVDKGEVIGNITKQVAAKLMSRKTAMTLLGEVSDVEAELAQILEESKQDLELSNQRVEKNIS